MDTENVQTTPASTGASDQPTQEVPPAAKPSEQPDIDKIVKERVDAFLKPEIEKYKREIQSTKDKAAAEVSRHAQRATMADTTLRTVLGKLKDTDPATATELELAQLRSETESRRQYELQEQQRTAQQQLQDQMVADLQESIKDIGVDPADPGLTGVGSGAKDWQSFQKAVLKKAVELKKEQDKVSKESDELKTLKAEITALKKQLNVEENSVETSTPGSTVAADKRVFTTDEINELSMDWKTNKETILKAQREGRIKE
jgi:hypothetical protein